MIENSTRTDVVTRPTTPRAKLRPNQQLRSHFVALARQTVQWGKSFASSSGTGLAIGVTSLAKGAGKSSVSFNLGSALASVGRSNVLLVESDFGSPFLSRQMGISKNVGLSEALAGEIELETAIHNTPIQDLAIVGCGLKNNQESLEMPFDGLPHMITEQAGEFGYLVFDLPLATPLTACHSITPFLDGIILTIQSNQLDQNKIDRFRQLVEAQGTEIIGVVINKA